VYFPNNLQKVLKTNFLYFFYFLSIIEAMKTIATDSLGRNLIKIKGNKCLLSRYTDLDDETKNELGMFFAEITGQSLKDTLDFLNFKSNHNKFCS
jgi:trans-2-enoyl-CoA reductase